MVQLLKNIIFLLAHTPGTLLLMAAVVFLVLGFVMGFLIWRRSSAQKNSLIRSQTRLRDEIATLKNQLAADPDPAHQASSGMAMIESSGDDLTKLSGITPEIAKRLRESGIRTYAQLAELEELTEQERQQFASTFGLGEINLDRWRWSWGGNAVIEEEPARPIVVVAKDDLTIIRGVTPDLENRLNRQGVTTFAQIAGWTADDIRQFSLRLGVGRQIVEERWVEQCRQLMELGDQEPVKPIEPEVVDLLFPAEAVRLDPRLGVVYTRRPELLDELQRIRGIGPMLEQELHRLGVFRFKQIALWTAGHLKEFAAKLNCFPDRMERDRWVEQARDLHAELYHPDTIWQVRDPSRDEWHRVIEQNFTGEPVTLNPPYGLVYPSAPSNADDLMRIEGMTPGSIAELRRLGIHRYEQIAHWPESTVEAVASFLGTSADRIYRDRWVSQARRLADAQPRAQIASGLEAFGVENSLTVIEPMAGSGKELDPAARPSDINPIPETPQPTTHPEGAVSDPALGFVFRAGRPVLIDDLKLIRGVGPVEEARLQQQGIYRFWQLAAWTPSQVSEVGQRCGFMGRIDREKWVEQAARLAILSEASQLKSYPAPAAVDQFGVLAKHFQGEMARVDGALGIVYGESPTVVDSLTHIQGIDPAIEAGLQRLGVFRFKQIGAWTDHNVAEIAVRLGVEKERIEREKWIPQALNLQRVIYAASPVWAEDSPSVEAYRIRAAEAFPGEAVEISEDLGILFGKRPAVVDALSSVQGIDPILESRLNSSGVYRFRQIANWSARNVYAFADWSGCHPDRIYKERWIPQSEELDKRRAQVEEPEIDPFVILRDHFAGESNVRVDRRTGVVYGDRPVVIDDLTEIAGISSEFVRRLHEEGIFRFKQVAHWSPSNVRQIASVLEIDPQRITGEQWVEQAARLHQAVYSASPVWSSSRPTPADYERRMGDAYAGDEVGADEELGILYAGRPDLYDDLKLITGITPEVEAKLNASGVFRYKQIADWSETNVRAFGDWLGIPHLQIYQQRWIVQAMQLTSMAPLRRVGTAPVVLLPSLAEAQFEAMAREFGDEPGVRIDRMFGIVYDDPPPVQDDLKQLPGVTLGMEDVFRQHGVFRFKQIAAWTPQNEEAFARALGMASEQFRAAGWPQQAKFLHDQTYRASGAWTVRRPSLEDYRVRISEVFPGEAVQADESLGILFIRRPAKSDDLTQISGLTPRGAARLNASGVYLFRQVANWADANVEAFARWIGTPAEQIFREDWVGQAAALAKEVATSKPDAEKKEDLLARYPRDPAVHWSADLGYVFQEAPAVVDDLTRIHGIDEPLAAGLTRNGIYRFWQIALWTTDGIDVISGNLDLGNRIKRERWKPQARILAVLGAANEDGRFEAPNAVDHFAVIEKEFAEEPDVRADSRFGVVYDQRPPVSDDLCKINGLTFAIEEELRRIGVYRYKQVANWSDANVAAFADATGLRKDDIESGQWIPQAAWLHLRVYGQSTRWAELKPSVDRFEELLAELFPGESVRVDEKFGFVYTGRPHHRDDLTRIRGINEALARRLQASGIHSFRQIAWWSDANVRSIAKRLGFHPEQVYRGQWISQAGKLDDERPEEELEVAPAEVSGDDVPGHEEGLSLHSELGPVFGSRPALVDDLKAINGVGPKIERMLNGLGIYRFSQIAGWTDTQVAAVSSRMRFRERIQREGWVEQARELAALRQAEHQESFFAPAQLDQIAVVERELHEESGARVDPYLGIVFDQPPSVADDLTAIDGIGKRMERELHEAGIFRYVQIANWTDGNVARVAENLSCLKDRIERDKWIPQARRLQRETYSASRAWGVDRPSLADYQARIEEEFSGEAVRPDAELGIVYTGWPSHVDDLKEILGIDAKVERALNLLGIYCVKQLANWSVANVEAIAKRLATSPQRIYRDRWIFQAGGLSCKEPLPVQPVYEGLDVDLRRVLSAQPGLEADERFGFIYRERPVDVDALYLIKGLGHALEKQINGLGVYRFRQMASWSDPQVEEFAQRLRIGSRIRTANWVGQAREWAALCEEERGLAFVAPSVVDHDAALEFDFVNDVNVRVDGQLGIVYDRAPSVTDDLNLINGIGMQMERELNELGVYRFKQIARWSDANVAEFARRLFCQKERIERDKWIPQAKRLLRIVYSACPEWAGPRATTEELESVMRQEFAGQRTRADKDYGIVFTERPARPDDLKEIPGISGKLEQEINAGGVWRFAQISRWSAANVEAFASRLQIPADRIYRDQWISKARQLAPPPSAVPATPLGSAPAQASAQDTARRVTVSAPRAASLPVAEPVVAPAPLTPLPEPEPEPLTTRNGSPVSPAATPTARPAFEEAAMVIDPDLGAIYRDRPSKIDELQLIQGIGPALERRLHNCGVYRYRQIADWNSRQIETYAQRLDVGGRIVSEEWITQAAELAEIVEAEESEGSFAAPARVDYAQIARQHFAGESGLRIDPRWGIVYDQKPENVDELREIDGITPKLERALNRRGVYQFRQIAHWSDPTVGVFAEALGLAKERIDRGKWIPQARRLELERDAGQPAERPVRSKGAEDFPGEDVEEDETYGVVYVARPAHPDNLKQVKGIGGIYAERLNSVGVYKFKQIAKWNDSNVDAFARLVGTYKQRIYQEDWIGQASALENGPRRKENPPAERAPRLDARQEEVLRRDLRGEDAVVSPELGIIFRTPPREVDDLTKIRGIGSKVENSLNDYGVYQFRQIALWTKANADEFSRRLEHFAGRMFREQWSEQARQLHLEKYGTEV